MIKNGILILFLFCGNFLSGQSISTFIPGIKVFSKLNYYTSEKVATIVCILPNSFSYQHCQLQLFDNYKKILKTDLIKGSVSRFDIPIQQIQFGKNQLNVKVFQNNTSIKDTIVEIIRLEPVANEVKIDLETGGLIVNHLPFFPFGFYCGPVKNIPEQEVVHGFNMIGPYQDNLSASYPERKTYMDRCAHLGVKVQYGVNSLIGSGFNGHVDVDKTEDEKLALLKNEIIAFRDHPALLSWYINDEPDGQGRSPQLLENAYKLIHELDPYHPISIVFMMPSKFHEFQNTMDIAMTDPYPVPTSVDISGYLQQLNNDFKYRKSIWLVPQAFGGQEMWSREPTAKEIRVMTYQGLIEGVQGIQYYVRSAAMLNPQAVSVWSECSNMAVETSQMTPFLLSDEKKVVLKTSNPDVLAKCFSYRGDKLILVVNKSNQIAPISLNLNLGDSLKTAELWFENRTIALHNSMLEDVMDAMSTRVYRIHGKKFAQTNDIYPGNIVFNPGFESVVSPGLPTGHHLSYGNEIKADHGATVFADSREQVDGLFSLRLQTPSDSGGVCVHLLPIILNAGDTYLVSIWAKAAKQDLMPHFRLAIDAVHQKKDFMLDSDWKKYSFLFKADVSTTNAIIELELMQMGTAWFDVVQVIPDPVIRYALNKDLSATVFISTTTDLSSLKYGVFTSGSSKIKIYKHPFVLKQASTITAMLIDQNGNIASHSIFVPVNKALSRHVRFETPYHSQYPAQGDSSLTNGIMGTTSFRDKKWLGFMEPEVSFVVDMVSLTDIHFVTVNTLSDANSGIFTPRSVSVFTSVDGVSFQIAGSKNNLEISQRGEPSLVPIDIACKGVKARFVKIKIKTFGEIPDGYLFKGSTSWMFTDEVLVR